VSIDLDSVAPEVWAYTRALVEASVDARPALTMRCRACDALLGRAGVTSAGPLFTSSWKQP
jgi:hypothetical protein